MGVETGCQGFLWDSHMAPRANGIQSDRLSRSMGMRLTLLERQEEGVTVTDADVGWA